MKTEDREQTKTWVLTQMSKRKTIEKGSSVSVWSEKREITLDVSNREGLNTGNLVIKLVERQGEHKGGRWCHSEIKNVGSWGHVPAVKLRMSKASYHLML